MSAEQLHETDPAVVARYFRLRTYFHDHLLAEVERQLNARYELQPTRRIPATLTTLVRNGGYRSGEGEIWPIVFLGFAGISLGLFVELSSERLAALGTVVNGPRPMRHHRHWEEMWGWEMPLPSLHPQLFAFPAAAQEATMLGWYNVGLEWLARNGLMKRK
jgi:hypothetical protein